jgi:hypothetical protein
MVTWEFFQKKESKKHVLVASVRAIFSGKTIEKETLLYGVVINGKKNTQR